MLVNTKARVGVFAIALGAYLPQFPSLVPEFEGQYADFKKSLPDTVELIDGGIVTTKELAQAAGDKFRAADVDLVILQLLTYATSYNMLPAVRDLDVPVVLVNLQKKKAPDYANTDTATWLGQAIDLYTVKDGAHHHSPQHVPSKPAVSFAFFLFLYYDKKTYKWRYCGRGFLC